MSTTTQTQHVCKRCNDTFEIGYQRGYCSEECWYAYKGDKALNTIRHDHRLCGSCFRVRAEVEKPRPIDQDWYIDQPKDGTFTLNPEEDTVDFETFGQEESYEAAIGRRYPTPNEDESGACLCGTIRTTEEHDILRPIELDNVLARLFKRLCEKERDGELDNRPDRKTFLRSFKDTRCIEYAVGKALNP